MNQYWVVEFVLPAGVFTVRRSDGLKSPAEVSTEILDAYRKLRQPPPELIALSLPSAENAALRPSDPRAVRLPIAHHGLDSVASVIAERANRRFHKHPLPWSREDLADLSEILREASAHH